MSTELSQTPKFICGAFVVNDSGEVLLRTTPSQGGRYTCINAKVAWGRTIEETLREHVLKKTGLTMKRYDFLGLTEALDIQDPETPDPIHMIFADYMVSIKSMDGFKEVDSARTYTWKKPEDWLKEDLDIFGQYIRVVIEKLA